MDKSTISMAIFNSYVSYVSLPEGILNDHVFPKRTCTSGNVSRWHLHHQACPVADAVCHAAPPMPFCPTIYRALPIEALHFIPPRIRS